MKKHISLIILTGIAIMVFLNACDKVQPPYKNEIQVDSTKNIKRVLCEEGTGLWCGYCVRGICYMKDMKEKYPDNWIGIAVHNDDPMIVTDYDASLFPLLSIGYPAGLIDRDTAVDPLDFESAYLAAITKKPPVDMSIINLSWNSTTRILTYTVQAILVDALNGDYRFNSILTEDSVHGTTAAWNQTNYYANNAQGIMCGFESLANPVPAASMYYDHVARYLFDGWDGIHDENIIPNTNSVGDTLKKTYTHTLPAGWNAVHINVIGFIINHADGTVVNACQAEHVGK